MKRTVNSFHDGRTGAAITVVLKYGTKATKVTKIEEDGSVKVDLMSVMPGIDADKELMAYLSKVVKVSVDNLDVLAGSDEKKLISIMDVSPEEVDNALHGLL